MLAMRWPLADDMAISLALSFYEELFKGEGTEVALLHARKKVKNINPNDYTWLSPILVMQGD